MIYYLDTCIWRDHFDDRSGQGGKPLGRYATNLIEKIMRERSVIIYSAVVLRELLKRFPKEEVDDIFLFLRITGLGKEAIISDQLFAEAEKIAARIGIPINDAIHACIAKENNAILVSRDAHFNKCTYFITVKKPEEL
jgi:predicted nucleic acid-binding protein